VGVGGGKRYGNCEGNGDVNGMKIETTVHLNSSWKLPVRLQVKRLRCLELQRFIY
jgi:hypothetical protein